MEVESIFPQQAITGETWVRAGAVVIAVEEDERPLLNVELLLLLATLLTALHLVVGDDDDLPTLSVNIARSASTSSRY